LAPAASPSPGEPFVGYWQARDDLPLDYAVRVIEILRATDGAYEVSQSGLPASVVPLRKGRLVIESFRERPSVVGYWTTPGFSVSWEHGGCVLYWQDFEGVAAERIPLLCLSHSGYLRAAAAWADSTTRSSLFDLYLGVTIWQEKHDRTPPAAAQLRPGSTFVRWLEKAGGSGYRWPSNPFTDSPVRQARSPGDFTYTAHGKSWTMIGYLSGDRSFRPTSP
jgi:hypothetical protein